MKPSYNVLCDEANYKAVYLQYSKSLYRFLVYAYGSAVDAEDITQNVFLKLWEDCSRFHLKNIKSLIFTMGKNMSLNQIKKNKISQGYTFSNLVYSQTPEHKLEEKEFHEKLINAIAQLTENERVVFMMNRLEDLSYKEISLRLNISQKAVEKRMHQALKKLHGQLSVNLKKK